MKGETPGTRSVTVVFRGTVLKASVFINLKSFSGFEAG